VKPRKEILLFAHCATCAQKKPKLTSQAEWARIEAGLTARGLQIWCRRCDLEVAHFTPEQMTAVLRYAQPAAPEPNADPPQIVQYDGHAWVRLGVYQSAEAQLAAVAGALRGLHVMRSQDAGHVVCASAVEDIADMCELSPPSPGAAKEET
jgi:hypothetical protein